MRPCPYCDYDLRGIGDPDRCPECGNLVASDYIRTLMRHQVHRDEQALYRIAVVGWGLHAAGFLLLMVNPSTFVAGAVGLAAAGALVLVTVLRSNRSRATWPRRFVRSLRGGHPGGVPKGFLLALAAWMLPSILLCGLIASLAP
jgi:hypothetical protein